MVKVIEEDTREIAIAPSTSRNWKDWRVIDRSSQMDMARVGKTCTRRAVAVPTLPQPLSLRIICTQTYKIMAVHAASITRIIMHVRMLYRIHS